MISTLNEVASYKNEAVVNRFKKAFPAHQEKAEIIFEDLMKFFWASQKHYLEKQDNPSDESLDFVFIMDEEMRIIDDMWHIFLLYTQDYMDYCENYFGEYIHHLPDLVPNMDPSPEKFEANLRRFLSYTYDTLGEEVMKRWFPIN
jgi:hypothetical protein